MTIADTLSDWFATLPVSAYTAIGVSGRRSLLDAVTKLVNERQPITCLFCEEPIAMGDELARHPVGTLQGVAIPHLECSVRAVAGGINHQMGKCTCCGGTEPPDPPELTKREAAKAAYKYFCMKVPPKVLAFIPEEP